ncbi:oocyte zinc finger protein XlCOF7.1 isoform X1 [Xenopus tropicalis]|uniref:Oocyte zinc finger protein XlCOF7.1 isoform X1 n=3 Tax=Xenopus tropicalis TaxID=8364 RepID=A0A8J1JIV4_XENTR|nr:oocyte zinc finger protein XlCOF7.1 isoform X1 [Xenopus tropicalis]
MMGATPAIQGADPVMGNQNPDLLHQRILSLTLEIIYLLTGEGYTVTKKSGDGAPPQTCTDCMLGGACRHHVTPTVGALHAPGSALQKENAKRILELISNIIQLLTGEVAITYEDVSICFPMEQWEILQGIRSRGVRKESNGGCAHGDGSASKPAVGADLCNAKEPDKTGAEGDPPNTDTAPTDPQTPTNCISHGIKEEPTLWEERSDWKIDAPVEQILGAEPPTDTGGSAHEIPNCIKAEGEWKAEPLTCQTQGTDPPAGTKGSIQGRDYGNDASVPAPCDGSQVMFYCNECHVCFICNKDLEIHQRNHRAEKPFSCSECGKCFANRSTLGAHQRIHTGEKPYVCPECAKCFRSRSHLFSHRNSHKSEKPFSCSECGKRFGSRSHLVSHQISHTEEKPFSCPVCEKCFKSKPQLTEHYRIHTGEKPFSCSTCGKSFTQRSHLIGHVRLHTGERPFSCSECGKSFGLQRDLNKHMKFHSGEKPFTCNECGKSFLLQGHLKRHFLIHTGEKPFSCSICEKRFGLQSNLNRHFRIHLQ